LLDEGSVTKAAERLFITQSAMSKSLARLRNLFGDPLLVRHGAGLVPTPLAEQLRAPLQQIVTKAESCFDFKPFDPAQARGKIKIAAPEQFALLTVPELLAELRLKAPGLSLEAQYLSDDFTDRLAAGETDFAVVRSPPDSTGFISEAIYSARPVCWCRKGHPLLERKRITLDDICAYPLLRMKTHFSPEEIEGARRQTAGAGLQTTIVLETEHMIVAIVSLVRSDALMIAPDFLPWLSIANGEIEAIPISHIPAFGMLKTDLHLVQHQRTASSPLHQWLADEIAGIFKATDC